MSELGVLDDAAVVIDDGGKIAAVGQYTALSKEHSGAEVVEVEGVLFPGFVDCHTHANFGAARRLVTGMSCAPRASERTASTAGMRLSSTTVRKVDSARPRLLRWGTR